MMTSDERQLFFLLKAGEMHTNYVLENAPVCGCGQPMIGHKVETEPEAGPIKTIIEHWVCQCGERVRGGTYAWAH